MPPDWEKAPTVRARVDPESRRRSEPLPVLTTDRVPATDDPDVALRLPPRLMLPVWLVGFHVKLPKAWPSPPGALVVAPVTVTVDAGSHVAAGIVPPFWACW